MTAIAKALELCKGKRLLILSDSQAAIAALVKAGKKGHGRTRELRAAVSGIASRCKKGHTTVCLAWVKSHIGIEGGEAADREAKRAAEERGISKEERTILTTEGGVRQRVSANRQAERQQAGWGLGRVPKWGRRAATWYTYLRTDRGPVGKCKKRIGKTDNDSCGKCGVQETGRHLVFECPVNKEVRKAYISGAKTCEDLDNKAMIRKGEWKVESFFGKVNTSKGWG